MSVNVINHRAAIVHLPNGKPLNGGANAVSDEDWAAAQCEYLQEMIRTGIISAAEIPKGNKTLPKAVRPMVLGEFKVADALKAIAECTDSEQLNRWTETDTRRPVQKALEKRWIELNPPAAAEKQSDGLVD